jgi:hypothetical protein
LLVKPTHAILLHLVPFNREHSSDSLGNMDAMLIVKEVVCDGVPIVSYCISIVLNPLGELA